MDWKYMSTYVWLGVLCKSKYSSNGGMQFVDVYLSKVAYPNVEEYSFVEC